MKGVYLPIELCGVSRTKGSEYWIKADHKVLSSPLCVTVAAPVAVVSDEHKFSEWRRIIQDIDRMMKNKKNTDDVCSQRSSHTSHIMRASHSTQYTREHSRAYVISLRRRTDAPMGSVKGT